MYSNLSFYFIDEGLGVGQAFVALVEFGPFAFAGGEFFEFADLPLQALALLRQGFLRGAGFVQLAGGDECAESTALDLVVTDVRMPPGMGDDGLRAAQALRERWLREGRGPLPVLVLSQYVAAGYLDRLLEHGGFGYLLKERVGRVADFMRSLEVFINFTPS